MHVGRGDLAAGRYVDALAMLEKAADYDPERPEPAYYEGLCHLGLTKQSFSRNDMISSVRYCDRAVASFDRAVSAFPGFRLAVQGKADALKLRGRHAAALEIANWAAAQSAFHPNMLLLKAREYARAGDLDKAQLTYQQAVSMEPDNAALNAEIGLFYMRCGNDADAIASLKRAYEQDPGAPGVAAALAHLGALSDARRGGGPFHPRSASVLPLATLDARRGGYSYPIQG